MCMRVQKSICLHNNCRRHLFVTININITASALYLLFMRLICYAVIIIMPHKRITLQKLINAVHNAVVIIVRFNVLNV